MRTSVLPTVCLVAALALPASASATTGGARTVTAPTESEQTVRLHVGDKLKVHLGTAYQRPKSSRPKHLQRLSYSGGYPTNTDARATFLAIAAGKADVTTTTDAACLHTTPRCMIAQQIWVVHVVIKQD